MWCVIDFSLFQFFFLAKIHHFYEKNHLIKNCILFSFTTPSSWYVKFLNSAFNKKVQKKAFKRKNVTWLAQFVVFLFDSKESKYIKHVTLWKRPKGFQLGRIYVKVQGGQMKDHIDSKNAIFYCQLPIAQTWHDCAHFWFYDLVTTPNQITYQNSELVYNIFLVTEDNYTFLYSN